ncbi:branched-chain amino acid ABC transporter substrate-binding protein [Fulvimarina endophytica]|uniref:Branched-chain amino acid ABC transporter substrate-binding protein n=1 Tax=Fulvimarina endophytica TaxID=2293836 RepID=A0A371X857_9HYPH|nr:ABC transporter substrate-binding protein [Fulvimarina endophytica]RFC65423.1 branched-chain amino acid ABC transporter substrate-binding protein [Fulvimarina endophytica]
MRRSSMSAARRSTVAAVSLAFAVGLGAGPAAAQDGASGAAETTTETRTAPQQAAKPQMEEVKIGLLRTYERTLALSVLDIPPEDIGVAGAEVAIADNDTTGSFMGQDFTLDTVTLAPGDDVKPAAEKMLADGIHYIVTDLNAEDTLAVADLAAAQNALVFNAGALDNRLRDADCRANLLHTAPSYAMLTDGLAQYLMWKQWRNWALVSGEHEADKEFAESLKRSATKFGGNIVGEKVFEDTGGARATDSGQALVQRQLPVFLQDLPDHDVLLVADESEVFGTYVPWRTWVPRPVAGTAGLTPGSWHPSSEQWGGAQIQNRFEDATGRRMLSKDMQTWTAVRVVGEAASRTQSTDPKVLDDFIKSPDFTIAAFKGQRLTFRDWNWQLRQPVLLATQDSVVSASPQEGFLHQVSNLDTLGLDRPESACSL